MVEEAFGIPELPEADSPEAGKASAKVEAEQLPPGLILPPLLPAQSND